MTRRCRCFAVVNCASFAIMLLTMGSPSHAQCPPDVEDYAVSASWLFPLSGCDADPGGFAALASQSFALSGCENDPGDFADSASGAFALSGCASDPGDFAASGSGLFPLGGCDNDPGAFPTSVSPAFPVNGCQSDPGDFTARTSASFALSNIHVSTAKGQENGASVLCSGQVVTAVFGSAFYIESDDRASGIRVEKAGHALAVGMRADISGMMTTNNDGERFIQATTATQTPAPLDFGSIEPLTITPRDLGGADWRYNSQTESGQEGVTDGTGLNNIGLMVTTFGAYYKTSATTFTLEDGSGVIVKCVVPAGVTLDPAWNYTAVTGISSCERVGGELHRLLRVRNQNDIAPL